MVSKSWRAIHRLDSVNSVISRWVVFWLSHGSVFSQNRTGAQPPQKGGVDFRRAPGPGLLDLTLGIV